MISQEVIQRSCLPHILRAKRDENFNEFSNILRYQKETSSTKVRFRDLEASTLKLARSRHIGDDVELLSLARTALTKVSK